MKNDGSRCLIDVGIALSSNYSQFINDVAHAAIIASMLVFFYFDRGIFF